MADHIPGRLFYESVSAFTLLQSFGFAPSNVKRASARKPLYS